ncbi:MAG: uroporphyrinogen decarboxylase family protein [Anaerolineae bacterium]|nr:uroporphyrinogen decarboxylase family protein [Anaerolineae bacterium]
MAAFLGEETDHIPVMPILHSGLPGLFHTTMGDYFGTASCMANTIIRGWQVFSYDGVQLSLGVTGEAQALGAEIMQPEHDAPILKNRLLDTIFDEQVNLLDMLDPLRNIDASSGGRMPLYYEAVGQVASVIGKHTFVLSLLRGPLLAASQLCGVETLLIAMIEQPERVNAVLDFTTDLVISLARWLLNSGAHGLMLGEATCSPNFISPGMYRDFVHPRHSRIINACHKQGWPVTGLHICGNIEPIFHDIVSTGVDMLDVDYQVSAQKAKILNAGRIVCRGNLDPSSVFRFGTPQTVRKATSELMREVGNNHKWILSSGCDIPPGTPEDNIRAFADTGSALPALT